MENSLQSGKGNGMEIVYVRHAGPTAWSVYESYLLGILPEKGTIIEHGKAFYIEESCFEIAGHKVADTPVPVVTTLDREEKTKLSVQAFVSGRRLPVGAAAALSPKGIFIFGENEWTPQESFEKLLWPEDITRWVMTAEEAEETYGLSDKKARKDCQNGLFSPREARKSGNAWLISREAADRVYGEGKEMLAPVNPFLFVFSTAEAGVLWNRDGGDVRAAAAGAGHRAARLSDGDCRHAGRIWLVTRMAMNRLYGPVVPEKMKALAETLRPVKIKRPERNDCLDFI